MNTLNDLEGMLEMSRQMLDKQQILVSQHMNSIDKDKSISDEDREFIKSMNTQVNIAMKNGDSEGLKSIMDQLTNKMTK